MLSGKIDLTEHRDFSTGQISLEDVLIRPMINGSRLSEEDYYYIQHNEKFFGQRHHSEYDKIFQQNNIDQYIEEMRTHCQRCGRPLKTLWNNNYNGICHQCSIELEKIVENGCYNKIPWKVSPTVPTPIDDRRILNMR